MKKTILAICILLCCAGQAMADALAQELEQAVAQWQALGGEGGA